MFPIRRLDSFFRHRDFDWNRTTGGWLDRHAGVGRHTLAGLLLASAIASLFWLGPTPTPGPRMALALATLLLTPPFLVWTMRVTIRRGWPVAADLIVQLALFAAIGGLIVLLAGPDAPEWNGRIYPHILMVLVGIFSVGLIVCIPLARVLFTARAPLDRFAPALADTELFLFRGTAPTITVGQFFWHFLIVPVRAPLQLLAPAALATLLAWAGYLNLGGTSVSWAALIGGATLALWWIVLALGGVDDRLSSVLLLFEGVLFRGSALLVSLTILLLAAARVANFSYVTTLFDGASSATILVWFASAYTVSWWYDRWANRLATEKLLQLLGTPPPGGAAVPYPIDPARVKTRVPAAGRAVQIHGAGRFVATCPPSAPGQSPFFQTYGLYDIFQGLAASIPGNPGVDTLRELRQRAWIYGGNVAMTPAILAALVALVIHFGPQQAELLVTRPTSGPRAVSAMLFDGGACGTRPIIIVAASGGGTRAALYTASVLGGLQRIGRLGDVRMVSGISGGGAALAYFASRREELLQGTPEAWDAYFGAMKDPYIQDVINGAAEWRLVSGTRLGKLLAESFERRWHLPDTRSRLGQIDAPGLILNSTITGRLDRAEACRIAGDNECAGSLEEIERRHRKQTRIYGGRLVFTNLALADDFDGHGLGPGEEVRLPIVVVNDPDTRLAYAASANANFPPVFSNAGVDIGERVRYWVSDGGVLDNRGMETLLYAVRQAIDEQQAPDQQAGNQQPPDQQTGAQQQGGACAVKRPIHLIVADASALSETFSQDRAVGTAIAAGAPFASQLAVELVADIKIRYRGGSFSYHGLTMPNMMRRSGAFGTHWMLQPYIAVKSASCNVTLKGLQMVDVLRALHAGPETGLNAASQQVLRCARYDPDGAADANPIPVASASAGADAGTNGGARNAGARARTHQALWDEVVASLAQGAHAP
jgi:hypothetical protein